MRPEAGHAVVFRERRKSQPPVPRTMSELGSMLDEYIESRDIYQGAAVSVHGDVSIVFASDSMLGRLNEACELHLDGTFKVLLTIIKKYTKAVIRGYSISNSTDRKFADEYPIFLHKWSLGYV